MVFGATDVTVPESIDEVMRVELGYGVVDREPVAPPFSEVLVSDEIVYPPYVEDMLEEPVAPPVMDAPVAEEEAPYPPPPYGYGVDVDSVVRLEALEDVVLVASPPVSLEPDPNDDDEVYVNTVVETISVLVRGELYVLVEVSVELDKGLLVSPPLEPVDVVRLEDGMYTETLEVLETPPVANEVDAPFGGDR